MYYTEGHYLFITIYWHLLYQVIVSHTSYLIFPCDTCLIFEARDYTTHYVFSVAVAGLSLSAGSWINFGSIYPVRIEV
jgi:hypothetical protein